MAKAMTISASQAIKVARDTAKAAGYDAKVTDTNYDEDEEEYEVELEDDDGIIITITMDAETGEVTELTTD